VRRAFDAHYGKSSAFVRWGEVRIAHCVQLQIVAVCFGGRALAGILLHLAATGMFSGMPDNTMVRAVRPNGVRVSGMQVQRDGSASTHLGWELVECADGPTAARVPLRHTGLLECTEGAAALADGTPLELRSERNRFGVGGYSMAVHIAATGAKCGYVGNDDFHAVRAGEARAALADGKWAVDALAAKKWTIAIEDDWTLHGALVEVKSKNDSLWTEQKLWIRSLTDRQFLRYPNPYLFNEDGSPTVDISTAKVAPKRRGKRKAADPAAASSSSRPRGGKARASKPAGGGGGGGKQPLHSRGGASTDPVTLSDDDFQEVYVERPRKKPAQPPPEERARGEATRARSI